MCYIKDFNQLSSFKRMPHPNTLKGQVDYLTALIQKLWETPSLAKKIQLLENEQPVKNFLLSNHPICQLYPQMSPLEQEVICSIASIGQAPIVFQIPEHLSDTQARLKKLLDQLLEIEKFYREIGGLIGYHTQIIRLLFEKESQSILSRNFQRAPGIDIRDQTLEVHQAVFEGIQNLPLMGEIYPIGGSGDRLDLKDEKTGLPLPTAKLMFLGRSLLTGLVRDLQAREFLYYKLYQKQCMTPIAMMTSEAKNNHQFVHQICEDNAWYHRPKNTFFEFMQPLAPVLTTEGNWSLKAPLQLYLKPSGHGVLWKIAQEKGVLKWFKAFHRPKILIRQINNPVAGTDNGLFALTGIGCSQNKAFGFASCDRRLGAQEGVNLLSETQNEALYEACISNVEYTDFEKNGIEDEPVNPNSPYSKYPSNTNILFADLNQVEKAMATCSIPGMLINMKALVPFLDEEGNLTEMKGGRLESTMQNIADYLTDSFSEPFDPKAYHELKTFLTYNERSKTISVTKKTHKIGDPLSDTPEGCYFKIIQNNLKLLKNSCGFETPLLLDEDSKTFLEKGPPVHFIYHPALGPLYSTIEQKLKGGSLEKHSELQLEIAALDLENLRLKGSLWIECTQPLGHLDDENILHFSSKGGRCTLWNIQVENKGIDFSQKNLFWKNQIHRTESLKIHLEENSEFYAENVIFRGSFNIKVPPYTKMTAYMRGDQVIFESVANPKSTWDWKYSVSNDYKISLKREEHP